MISYSVYEAEDGKKFNNEEDCIDYEAELRAKKFANTACLYDESGNPLPLTEDGFGQAYYIVAHTDEAARYMVDEFGCYPNPWQDFDICAGCWVYIDTGEWASAELILKWAKIVNQIS